MKMMKMIPTRAGLIGECTQCKTRLTIEQMNDHECMVVFVLQCQRLVLKYKYKQRKEN